MTLNLLDPTEIAAAIGQAWHAVDELPLDHPPLGHALFRIQRLLYAYHAELLARTILLREREADLGTMGRMLVRWRALTCKEPPSLVEMLQKEKDFPMWWRKGGLLG